MRLPDHMLVKDFDSALTIYKPVTAIAEPVMLRTMRFNAIK